MLFAGTVQAVGSKPFVAIRLPDRLCRLSCPARLPAGPFRNVGVVLVRLGDSVSMANGETFPTHVSANERCIDVNDFPFGDFRFDTGFHTALKNPAKAFGAPALWRMRVKDEWSGSISCRPPPTNQRIATLTGLSASAPPIVDNPEQNAGEPQTDSDFWGNAGAAVSLTVEVRDLRPQPREIEHAVDTRQNVIVRHELS